LSESKNTTVFGLDLRFPEQQVFLVLLLLSFTVAITTGTWDLGNSQVVFLHEWIFIGAYFVLLRQIKPLLDIIRRHPLVVLLVVAWLISISLSLYFSPLGLRHITIAQNRYFETITHVVFFGVLLSYFSSYALPLKKLMMVILLSYALVVIHAFLTWHFSPDPQIHDHRMWFSHFPFTGHARHAGYNMMVAVIMGLFLFVDGKASSQGRGLYWLGLLLVLSCLIWLGGRGSMLSVVLALVFAAWWLRGKCAIDKKLFFPLVILLLLGIAVSQQLSVFSFNGLWNSFSRSVEAESINRLSSGRLNIWSYSLEAIKKHYWFGLGSQGYIFMPERELHRTAMPHNMIVQFLVEWGVIGTSFFLGLLGIAFYRGLAKLKQFSLLPVSLLASAVVCIALSVHGLTDGTYYHGKPGFYLALCFAIWLGAMAKIQAKDQTMLQAKRAQR
jgi:O-antigen ligase